jgi:hypothetical protein
MACLLLAGLADFLTEYITADPGSTDSSTAHTLSNSVTLANAFAVTSYESAHTTNDMREAMMNFALTGATTLTSYRDGNPAPNSAITIGCWVVRAGGTEFDVQRFAVDLAAATTNDTTVTEIDQ